MMTLKSRRRDDDEPLPLVDAIPNIAEHPAYIEAKAAVDRERAALAANDARRQRALQAARDGRWGTETASGTSDAPTPAVPTIEGELAACDIDRLAIIRRLQPANEVLHDVAGVLSLEWSRRMASANAAAHRRMANGLREARAGYLALLELHAAMKVAGYTPHDQAMPHFVPRALLLLDEQRHGHPYSPDGAVGQLELFIERLN